ncbi:hypothetical protein [Bifidobacterium oedipodis]|uniref:Uncharacterized protein n=1 Tax=Bifidobacterium oedipodis TaxID=2675322 RepID=A0A7Y0EMX8_9BIFI|nr:hypothetical protein [Bifidobacterium sp. DSM 109957]NMM93186.1 hypothetical protein [Bifidobacterium sp. DSM 109957]
MNQLLNLPLFQLLIALVLYLAYLAYVMLGGMRKRKAGLRRFIIMIVVLFWGLTQAYDGVHTEAEILDLALITAIALVKAWYLGHKKMVEQIDGVYYIWHDMSYVRAWFMFFVGKIILTAAVGYCTHITMPIWHIVFYFCVYFTLRSAIIVYLHPQAFLRSRR